MSLPVALDTTVVVRLIVNDESAQAEQTATLIDVSAMCFVPITVVLHLTRCESSGVLISFDRQLVRAALQLNPLSPVQSPAPG